MVSHSFVPRWWVSVHGGRSKTPDRLAFEQIDPDGLELRRGACERAGGVDRHVEMGWLFEYVHAGLLLSHGVDDHYSAKVEGLSRRCQRNYRGSWDPGRPRTWGLSHSRFVVWVVA